MGNPWQVLLNCVTVILTQIEDFIDQFRGKPSRYLYSVVKKTFMQYWWTVFSFKMKNILENDDS